ncbi:MAG: hypothetical protein L3J46_06840 [Kangiellaceae bacterium]|nr:hypothetical protein [Kangiellaceae bacterium]
MILAEDELAKDEITIKYLREHKQQLSIKLSDLDANLQSMFVRENSE